jgi:hypothetical protein
MIKCSLDGIENKKNADWHLFPVVVTADTVEAGFLT